MPVGRTQPSPQALIARPASSSVSAPGSGIVALLPSRSGGVMNEPGMVRLNTLLDRTTSNAPPVLTTELRALYGGDLRWVRAAGIETAGAPAPARNRPHVIANFVASLDGVVSYKLPGHSGGAAISGGLFRAGAGAPAVSI